jgi:HK97 gp10 family phage protein
MADAEFKLEGIEELVTKNGRLVMEMGPIVRELLTKCALTVERKAKINAPVSPGGGRLRSSITHQVGPGQVPEWAEAGTNVNYARPVEFGTLSKCIDPGSANKGRPGGMEPRQYMARGFKESEPDFEQFVDEATKKIEETWQ